MKNKFILLKHQQSQQTLHSPNNYFDDTKIYSSINPDKKQSAKVLSEKGSPQIYKLKRVKSSNPSRRIKTALNVSNSNCFDVTKLLRTDENETQLQPQSEDQLAVINYLQNSLLQTQHDQILKQLKIKNDIQNRLNLNYFGLKSEEHKNLSINPNLTYSLFTGIMELDQEIIKPLFTTQENKKLDDEIGMPLLQLTGDKPCQKFKPDYLTKTQSIISELISKCIRQIKDVDFNLAIALESLGKYFVALFDVVQQWSLNRCEYYVDLLVGKIRARNVELEKENDLLEEARVRLVEQTKQAMQEAHSKYLFMEDVVMKLKQRLGEQEYELEKFRDLSLAEDRMNNVGIQVLELDKTVRTIDKQLVENWDDMKSQFTSIAKILVKRKNDQVPQYQRVNAKLKTKQIKTDKSFAVAAFQHPFNAYYLALPLNPDSITDAHSLLEKFYNSLSQSIYQLLRTATPVPLHFVQEMGNQWWGIIQFLLENHKEEQDSQSNLDDCINRFFSLIFGINNQLPLQINTVKNLLEISQKLTVFDHSKIDQEINLSNELRINLQDPADQQKQQLNILLFYIPIRLQDLIPTFLHEDLKFHLDLHTDKLYFIQLLRYCQLALLKTENDFWYEYIDSVVQRISEVGITGNWITQSRAFIDERKIWNYLMHKQCKKRSSKEDKFAKSLLLKVRQLYALNPSIFWKYEEVFQPQSFQDEIKEKSPIRKSTLKKRGSLRRSVVAMQSISENVRRKA